MILINNKGGPSKCPYIWISNPVGPFSPVFIAMTVSPLVLSSYKPVEVAFSSAIRILDKQFGEGYAKKNPQLIASLSQIILDNSPTDSSVSDPTETDTAVPSLVNPDDDLLMIFSAYADYENKIISSQDVMNKLRDYYYQSACGMGYDEWQVQF